ncbi:hypothetical protein T484DRAFT_1960664 [Baffinella frigidus]|nr:hypothetical protein T484DRAFT_1960664 [Cryptophyta sp. CCMP2293]
MPGTASLRAGDTGGESAPNRVPPSCASTLNSSADPDASRPDPGRLDPDPGREVAEFGRDSTCAARVPPFAPKRSLRKLAASPDETVGDRILPPDPGRPPPPPPPSGGVAVRTGGVGDAGWYGPLPGVPGEGERAEVAVVGRVCAVEGREGLEAPRKSARVCSRKSESPGRVASTIASNVARGSEAKAAISTATIASVIEDCIDLSSDPESECEEEMDRSPFDSCSASASIATSSVLQRIDDAGMPHLFSIGIAEISAAPGASAPLSSLSPGVSSADTPPSPTAAASVAGGAPRVPVGLFESVPRVCCTLPGAIGDPNGDRAASDPGVECPDVEREAGGCWSASSLLGDSAPPSSHSSSSDLISSSAISAAHDRVSSSRGSSTGGVAPLPQEGRLGLRTLSYRGAPIGDSFIGNGEPAAPPSRLGLAIGLVSRLDRTGDLPCFRGDPRPGSPAGPSLAIRGGTRGL